MWVQSIQLPVVASKWGRWAGQTLRTTPYLALKLACEAVSLKNYKYVGNVLRTLCAHSRWWFPWSISAPTENVSLFFFLFCLCNQRQPCLHCYNYSYIYLWLYCMYVPVQVQVQFFCFHEKAKSLEPNAPPCQSCLSSSCGLLPSLHMQGNLLLWSDSANHCNQKCYRHSASSVCDKSIRISFISAIQT